MAAAQEAQMAQNAYESEIEPEYTLKGQQEQQEAPKPKSNVAIPNPNFVDPGMETENEYNKTHEMTRDEVHTQKKISYESLN